jgi:ATP-dependent DNA helicase RecG
MTMKQLAPPLNIQSLLAGKHVEHERLEFKKGWNPESILHTICAFANDFHNLGGGYVVVGANEKNGIVEMPPVGVAAGAIDSIQKELIQIGHTDIRPEYHPQVYPCIVDGRHIIIIWCPGGESRPYKAKLALAKDCKEYVYYIRRNSSTQKAKIAEEQELLGLAASVPFDDRVNQQSSLSDLSPKLIAAYLDDIGSDLADQAFGQPIDALARQMQIARGPDEFLCPLNVGLLFFSDEPFRFFPQTQIDVLWMPEGAGGTTFSEKCFQGPLSRILTESLDYIKRNFLTQAIVKHPDKPESTKHFNYPFAALEEAVVNAIYHRSYEEREPVEIRITPAEISILSFPGPDRSISLDRLQEGRAVARRYRNRRIGEFLKELDLCEGRATGIPKMIRESQENGSPLPLFETDDDRTYFLVTFPVHPHWKDIAPHVIAPLGHGVQVSVQDSVQVGVQDGVQVSNRDSDGKSQKGKAEELLGIILLSMQHKNRSKQELMKVAGAKRAASFTQKFLAPLLKEGLVEMTIPESRRSRYQAYRLTELGRARINAAYGSSEGDP